MAKIDNTMSVKVAASLVRRMVAKLDKDGKRVLDKDNNPVPVEATVSAEEVMAHQEYDDKIVVVTIAGEKLTCEKSSEIYKAWAKAQK